MAFGVAMSIYHIHIAYSGGYEPMYQRCVSYLFAVTMIYLIHPGRAAAKGRPGGVILWVGTLVLAVASVGWLLWNYDYFLERFPYVDPPTRTDLFFGTAAIILVLEACRRTINLALPLISLAFLVYTYIGPYMPWKMAHVGTTFTLIVDYHYMTTDGLALLGSGLAGRLIKAK